MMNSRKKQDSIPKAPVRGVLGVFAALALSACAAPVEEPLAHADDNLRVDVARHAAAYDYAHRNELVTAAAGDGDVVFVAEPLAQRVVALDRVTGAELGDLPAPPGGWLLPFTLRVPSSGKLVVLDSGGLPAPGATPVARVYDYDFRLRDQHRLEATLTRSVRFDGLPLVFAEDVEVLPSGTYVVAESFIGALWLVAPDGTITPGIFPDAAPIAPLAPCAWTPTTVNGVQFGLAGGFASGVVALAARGPDLFFAPTCLGGVFRVPIAIVTDPSLSAADKAAAIVAVSPRAATTPVETLEGITFNPFDRHDRYLYATDSLNLRVIRIDPDTGARQTLLTDPVLFNFPVHPQFVPPVAGVATLLVPSDQEYRSAIINQALDHDIFQPPWTIAKVVVF